MTAPGRFRRRIRASVSKHWVYGFLAVLAYVPPLLVQRGRVGADNKVYLYLDPSRMLRNAAYLWDPNTFAGTVPHQGVGYLFPVAPYYWLTHQIGLPTWIAQRIWLASVVFFAGAGVVYLLRALRWRGPGVLVAACAYMFTPYFLNYASAFTVIALPWTGLPWMIAFAMLSVRHGGWRYPALFALTIQMIGSVNASSLAFSLLAAVLWFPFAVWVTRETTFRPAAVALTKMGVLTFFCSLWWMSGLWAQSRYGIDVLRFSETARTVAEASTPTEVLRGLGYWYFYGTDKLVTIVGASRHYTTSILAVGLSFLVPVLALCGSAVARFRERAYFSALMLVGLVLSVGAYPWQDPPLVGGIVKWFLTSSQSGSAMRSLPRAAPLVVLGLAAMLGAGVTSYHEKLRLEGIPRPLRFVPGIDQRVFAASAVLVVLTVLNMPALATGWFITPGLSRPSEIPNYWQQNAAALDAGDHATRIFEIPGSNFASYRWNGTLANPVDPITPGLTSRPFLAREQVAYGTPPTANLLVAFDDQLQQNILDPRAVAPIARFFSAGDLNVRSDLAWERYGTVRPTEVWDILGQAPGLGEAQVFGGMTPQQTDPRFPMLDEATLAMQAETLETPRLAIVPVEDAPTIVKSAPVTAPVLLDGDGTGLVDSAGAGLLSGRELVLYSAALHDDQDTFADALADDAVLVVTDSNRRRAQRWGTIADTFGTTETAGEQPLIDDPSDQRLDIFDDAGGDAARTVTVQRGGVTAVASAYGNPVTYTPDVRAQYAVDGNLDTAWMVGAFGPVAGERIRLGFTESRTTDHITLHQPTGGDPNRWITEVKLTFDDGTTVTAPLDASSRGEDGQRVQFPRRTFSNVEVEIVADNVGRQYNYKAFSAVGFSEIVVGDDPPTLQEVVRLPTDLLSRAGRASGSHPLTLVMTRERVNRFNPLRNDSEAIIARTWHQPTTRSFAMSGTARLDPNGAAGVIDRFLGLVDAAHGGVDVAESRHLAGAPDQRATSAIDGDPTTWWTTGFLSSEGDFAAFTTARPVEVDTLELSLVADRRHSLPTSLAVTVDGRTQRVPVPKVVERDEPGAVQTVEVKLPEPVRGSKVRVEILRQRDRTTNDWYTNNPIVLPVAIAEFGIAGLHATMPDSSAALDRSCRAGHLLVDTDAVGIALTGTVGDALAGRALPFTSCGADAHVKTTTGDHTLLSADGLATGLAVDQVVLRSTADGAADPATGLLEPSPGDRPSIDVAAQTRTSFDLDVKDITGPFWLVLGQSQSEGWVAKVNGKTLGTSTLVDGYANGWKIDPGDATSLKVELVWTPQRVVWVAIGLSVIAALLCLAIVVVPMRRRQLAPLGTGDHRRAIADASVPLAWDVSRALRYGGAAPKLTQAVAITASSGVVAGALMGWWAGPIVGAAAFACLRFRRARPVLTLGAPVALVLSTGYYLTFLVFRDAPVDFGWPDYFARVAPLGWFAVIFAVLDVVVDRCWLRRWWPSAESEL